MEYFIGFMLVIVIIQLWHIQGYLRLNCKNQVKQAEQIAILFERMNKK